MIFRSKSNYIHAKTVVKMPVLNLLDQGDFLAGFTLVAVHYFHVPLGCGYTLVPYSCFVWYGCLFRQPLAALRYVLR